MKHSAEQLDQATNSRKQRFAKRVGVLFLAAPAATFLLSGVASAEGNPSPEKAPHAASTASTSPAESPSPTETVSPSPDVTPTSLPSPTEASPSPSETPVEAIVDDSHAVLPPPVEAPVDDSHMVTQQPAAPELPNTGAPVGAEIATAATLLAAGAAFQVAGSRKQ
jgi:hypothetical protein